MALTVDDVKERAAISAPEVAQLLDISTQSAYRAVRGGHLPSIRLGRKVVIPTKPLLDLLGHSGDDVATVRELQTVGS